MIILASHSSNGMTIIYSGLLAALMSAVFSAIISIIAIHYQNKRNEETLDVQKEISEASINMQKEIANKGQKGKLIYETQLSWANKLRETTAKLYGDWSKLQDSMNVKLENKTEQELSIIESKIFENIYIVQQDIILIELYFSPDMDKNAECFQALVEVLKVINNIKPGEKNPNLKDKEVVYFIETLRNYFKNQMSEMVSSNS